MRFTTWFRFALTVSVRNMWRNPRRTIFSLLSIAIAMAAMMIFQSWVAGVEESFRRNVIQAGYGHFKIYKKGFRIDGAQNPFGYQIEDTSEMRAAIEKNVGKLAMFSRRQTFYGFLSAADRTVGAAGEGVDAQEERHFLRLIQVKEGKHLADSSENAIFLGSTLAEQLAVKVGDPVVLVTTTQRGSMNARDMFVEGIFTSGVEELDAKTFYTHIGTAQSILGSKGAPQVLLGFDNFDESSYITPLNRMFAKQFPDFEVVHWRSIATFFDNTMEWLRVQYAVSRVIILGIAALSIANVFLITLLERLGEFGTLRALGTHRWEIGGMAVIESMVQAVIGTILGSVIGILVLRLGLQDGITMPPPLLMNTPFHVDLNVQWEKILGLAVMCALVAGLSGLLPAIKMSRTNIVKALGRNI